MAKSHPTNIAIGKNKGYPVTKLKLSQKQDEKVKPATLKSRLAKRTKLIRSVISEVSGLSVYEKRVMELLKGGSLKDNKKALKVAKKALGTHCRAKIKREGILSQLRAQQATQKKEKKDK